MPSSPSQLTLGLTMGDPLGIGAEVILKALPKFRDRCNFKVFGDAVLLDALPAEELVALSQGWDTKPTALQAGQASVTYLEAAMAAWKRGEIQGLITAPISKEHVLKAGFSHPGHTEYLAVATDAKNFQMMMVGPKLRVSLVTIHEPLAQISGSLTEEKITRAIGLTYQGLRDQFGIPKPRVAVAGLNPHAGEAGHLGREEIEIIAPAIEAAQAKGWDCSGPLVPDAVFHEAYSGKWDAVVCMYHDQGLIPFKMLHFDTGVNLTLGLPLIRTSPDHGTAMDIAGQGIADSGSMEAAIGLCLELVEKQNRDV